MAPIDASTFRAGEVPTVSVGAIVDPTDDAVLPALVLATDERPDVVDLVRVHATDGVGDLRCGIGIWDLGEPDAWLVRLEVAVDHPVHCRFHTVLTWATHRSWLASVADAGALALGTGDHEGRWLVLTVDPDRLGPLLALPGADGEERPG